MEAERCSALLFTNWQEKDVSPSLFLLFRATGPGWLQPQDHTRSDDTAVIRPPRAAEGRDALVRAGMSTFGARADGGPDRQRRIDAVCDIPHNHLLGLRQQPSWALSDALERTRCSGTSTSSALEKIARARVVGTWHRPMFGRSLRRRRLRPRTRRLGQKK